jgi:hypothetical protein
MPLGEALFMARIVKAILTARGTMEINDQLEAMIPRPGNGFQNVGNLTLDVRFSRADVKSPKTDGKAYVVQSGSGDGSKIVLSDECVPVLLEFVGGGDAILELTKSPFIDNPGVTGAIEETRGDPRLKKKPSAKVYTANLLGTVGKTGTEWERCGEEGEG